MIKLRIGGKSAFFFCGDLALSRKSNPSLEITDVENLDVKVVKGILRAISTSTIFCDEGIELLESKLEVKEEQKTVAIEEVQAVQEVEEVAPEIETQVEEVKKPTTRQSKAKPQPEK